jgi:hypothetical protein
LNDLLKGGLGGLLAGGAAGSVLSGGLGGLLKQFQDNGQGDVASTWVGKGPNQNISESDLARSIGPTTSTRCRGTPAIPRRTVVGAEPRTAGRHRRADPGRPSTDAGRGLALGVRIFVSTRYSFVIAELDPGSP